MAGISSGTVPIVVFRPIRPLHTSSMVMGNDSVINGGSNGSTKGKLVLYKELKRDTNSFAYSESDEADLFPRNKEEGRSKLRFKR